MRSALTVLGVVIGITSIVGMTAMIRGFDQSLRGMIAAIGPNTIFVQRFGVTSFAKVVTSTPEIGDADRIRMAPLEIMRMCFTSGQRASAFCAQPRPQAR